MYICITDQGGKSGTCSDMFYHLPKQYLIYCLMEKIFKIKKQRVRFCWECGRNLCGNHHVEIVIDGHSRILHKQCAKAYQS